jgi:hypothetical protein
MDRNCGCQRRMRQKGGGLGQLPRGQLALTDQGILHGLRQATEEVGVEEDVGICW